MNRVISFCFALLFTGCVGLSSSTLNHTTWSTQCGYNEVRSVEASFSDTEVTLTSKRFIKPGCRVEVGSVSWKYGYVIGKEIGTTHVPIRAPLSSSEELHPLNEFDLTLESIVYRYRRPADLALHSFYPRRLDLGTLMSSPSLYFGLYPESNPGEFGCLNLEIEANQSLNLLDVSGIKNDQYSFEQCKIAFQDGFNSLSVKNFPFYGYEDNDFSRPIRVQAGMKSFGSIVWVVQKNLPEVLYFSSSFVAEEENRPKSIQRQLQFKRLGN